MGWMMDIAWKIFSPDDVKAEVSESVLEDVDKDLRETWNGTNAMAVVDMKLANEIAKIYRKQGWSVAVEETVGVDRRSRMFRIVISLK